MNNISFSQVENTVRNTLKGARSMTKSIIAGYPNRGTTRTGISSLAKLDLSGTIEMLTLQDEDFLLTKNIKSESVNSNVVRYRIKNGIGVGREVAITEVGMPQETSAEWMEVEEVTKVYAIRKSITDLAETLNDAGGYEIDLLKEHDEDAMMVIAEAKERHLYHGGDYIIGLDGKIDGQAANRERDHRNNTYFVRQVRGIQANIREGNFKDRGIHKDFVGYNNNSSTIFDLEGKVLDRHAADQIVTSVGNNRGKIGEVHCTGQQLTEYRAQYEQFERADLSALYQIGGAKVSNDHGQVGTVLQTVNGPVNFIPAILKYMEYRPRIVPGAIGQAPATPLNLAAAADATITADFDAGETFFYIVQAINFNGRNGATAPVQYTVAAADAGKAVRLTWDVSVGAEAYNVYRTVSGGREGEELFIGTASNYNAAGGVVTFIDAGAIEPGLTSMLFMPSAGDRRRATLLKIGGDLNKLDLGRLGLAKEHLYVSYWGVKVQHPRGYAIVDNAYEVRNGVTQGADV